MMKWIDSTDLANWAVRRDCQEMLPFLVRKLIRATSNSITNINFPSGESILLGGWDGILSTDKETEYIPSGVSLWEFGANKDIKGKADGDYSKRSKNSLGFNPADSTFIFVTPRHWTQREKWTEEKKESGIWKDIKVIDADSLEEWIEITPTIGSWLAKHLGKYPSEGIQPTDDFWEEWSSGTKFSLNEKILIGGRENERTQIIDAIKTPSIIAIQGISREESLAFIISCFKNNQYYEEDFFSRSIIVDNPETYRKLSVHNDPLILIPIFDDNGVINRAFNNGHTIIVPLGADSSVNWNNKIVLPRINRDSFVKALEEVGITRAFAEKYSKESVRNITILRRQLEFDRTIPEWALFQNVSDIIPALIIGRWDENFEDDKKIIAKIANDSYENYIKKLNKWQHTQDSPFIKIGSNWRLTSPFDAWTNASRHITPNDFKLLHQVVIDILTEINPIFKLLPEERYLNSKRRKFSSWIREGVIQSLILVSVLEEKIILNTPQKADLWVDSIISELLKTDNFEVWKSLEDKLPLIAEASPAAFLDALEKHLSSDKTILSLFDEDPGFLTEKSYHTGLLWGLESLAWFPEYLSRVTLILAKLSAIDPGGKLSNRPINSLSEIFKPWLPQTLASFDERIQVLKLIAQKEPEIGWILLQKMLPSVHETAYPTHKTRWRMFELETEKNITWNEIYHTYSVVTDILLSIFDFTETKLAKFIDESDKLPPSDRDKILSFTENNTSRVEHKKHEVWHACRELLYHHRSCPNAQWALSESELSKYEHLYNILKPTDEINNTLWMFDEYFPKFVIGYQSGKMSDDAHTQFILKERINGLTTIYQKHGLQKIVELISVLKEVWIMGDILAYIVNVEEEIILLSKLLLSDETKIKFMQSFIYRKSILNKNNWGLVYFEKFKRSGLSNLALSRYLLSLNQNQDLWDFIEKTNVEIIDEYWKKINPQFSNQDQRLFGIKKLLKYNRSYSAVNASFLYENEIPTNLIVEILQKTGTIKAEDEISLDSYHINKLFDALDKRDDVDDNIIANLEWLFLPLLTSYGNDRQPERLHKKLSTNPLFFIDVLKLIYNSDDEDFVDENKSILSEEQLKNRTKMVLELLYSWKKIPGVDMLNNVDAVFLKNWVNKVRELAIECGRSKVADSYIGKVLANYPESNSLIWPHEEICNIIETINSESINQSFSCEIFNKRGFSSRGPFDGGNIERNKASYFKNLAEVHRNKYPVIAKIFENRAKGYEEYAKQMDEDAEKMNLDY